MTTPNSSNSAQGPMATACEVVLDRSGFIVSCGQAAADFFGVSATVLLGKHILDFIPGIRINPETPGNNIALTAFLQRCNLWHDHRILDLGGKEVLIQVLPRIQPAANCPSSFQ